MIIYIDYQLNTKKFIDFQGFLHKGIPNVIKGTWIDLIDWITCSGPVRFEYSPGKDPTESLQRISAVGAQVFERSSNGDSGKRDNSLYISVAA